jgi:uncharacterized protein
MGRCKIVATFLAASSIATILIGAPIADAAEGKRPAQLTILGGVSGGNDYIKAVGLAKIFGDRGVKTNAETGGMFTNVIQLDRGNAQLGVSMDFVPTMQRAGEKPFPAKSEDARGIMMFSASFTHVLVTKDSGVTSIDQLKGKKFATQPVGTGSQYIFATLLNAYGLAESDLQLFSGGQSYGVNQVKDRNAIGMTATTVFPGGTISELATTIDVQFLGVSDEAFKRVQAINPGLVRLALPAKTYPGQTEPIQGVGTGSILVTSAKMPDDEVYWITKTIVENLEEYKKVHASLSDVTKESLAAFAGVPMHPGAARYYKEAGLIK